MDPKLFTAKSPGRLVSTTDGAQAFLPDPLPRNLGLSPSLGRTLGEARAALAALAEGGRHLPNPELFVRPLQKQEAVLSSRIEGTRTTLEEVFAEDASGLPAKPDSDSQEVQNYIRALNVGLESMKTGRPLSLALLKDLHRVLLTKVRGQDKTPGVYRKTQVWLGESESIRNIRNARFVPPPPEHVQPCMDALEKYMLEPSEDDSLIRMALTHYQFETIHPFNDGNGRAGRLLIILQCIHERLQDRQWLYVSSHIETRRQEYYDRLLEVSLTGDYNRWIGFFLIAVRESALHTASKIQSLRDLMQVFTDRLAKTTTHNPRRLVEHLQGSPYLTVSMASDWLQVGYQAASAAVARLVDVGILQELSWKLKGSGRPSSVYKCQAIIDIINRDVST